ncbi:AbrB/MazE/SpoVT family DNA-binding domain-containing protein [soil metagenome]|jgi:AbrB family looped-hinge helix DNA binding protein|nr:AbrB/MazE/SpoVT family DNA-binding domain-containing protein [Deinococcota bacterium]
MATTLTQKGQVTVPKRIRDGLKLRAGDRIEFVLHEDGKVEMIPLQSAITSLRGIVKVERTASVEEMNEAIAEAASGDIDWD